MPVESEAVIIPKMHNGQNPSNPGSDKAVERAAQIVRGRVEEPAGVQGAPCRASQCSPKPSKGEQTPIAHSEEITIKGWRTPELPGSLPRLPHLLPGENRGGGHEVSKAAQRLAAVVGAATAVSIYGQFGGPALGVRSQERAVKLSTTAD